MSLSILSHLDIWKSSGYRVSHWRWSSKDNSNKPVLRYVAGWAMTPEGIRLSQAIKETVQDVIAKPISKEEAKKIADAWNKAAFDKPVISPHWQQTDQWHKVQRKYLAHLYETGEIGLFRYIKDRIHLEIAIAWES